MFINPSPWDLLRETQKTNGTASNQKAAPSKTAAVCTIQNCIAPNSLSKELKARPRLDIDDFILVEHSPGDRKEPFTIHSIPFAQSS